MASSDKDDLPFEKPLAELKRRIEELQKSTESAPGLQQLLQSMETQYEQVRTQLYENLSPWNTVELARHPKRPQARDYIGRIVDGFQELHGDRQFRDDLAIVTGLGSIGPHRVMVIAQHKGRDVNERHVCHAGCPHPEGYWKALRKMRLAERFHLPVVCLIDTKGAYPGIGSEERGVAVAIAENLRAMSSLRTPIVCAVIGEGGSGGALGIAVGDRILMLRHAYYSVISPEGCASILWRDGEKKAQAAAVLKLTSRDLKAFDLVDEIIEEPLGGAHRDPEATARSLKDAIVRHLSALAAIPLEELLGRRYDKYRSMGAWIDKQAASATGGVA
jgi:acetyl-CoA carboxylase carboxyl transferase subunit alpha